MNNPILKQILPKIHYEPISILLWGVELAWLERGNSCWGIRVFHTFCCTPDTSIVPLGCGSPHSLMAFTVFAEAFRTISPRLTFPFLRSDSKSRTVLETDIESTNAIFSHSLAIALCIAVSISALEMEAELTILEAVTLGDSLLAAMKDTQFFDHEGCASLQFAHFDFDLSLA